MVLSRFRGISTAEALRVPRLKGAILELRQEMTSLSPSVQTRPIGEALGSDEAWCLGERNSQQTLASGKHTPKTMENHHFHGKFLDNLPFSIVL